jgi:RNA polymerase sigma-70 factor (ECF subfamily)
MDTLPKSTPTEVTDSEWQSIVSLIMRSDPQGAVLLYDKFKFLKGYFSQQVEYTQSEDLYHQAVLDLLRQISSGYVRNPEALNSYVWTVARRKAVEAQVSLRRRRALEQSCDDVLGLTSRDSNPEVAMIEREQRDIAMRVLQTFRPRDREVLVRFYLQEQTAEDIQRDLGLTPTQFRLVKSRAKARFSLLLGTRLSSRRRLNVNEQGRALLREQRG